MRLALQDFHRLDDQQGGLLAHHCSCYRAEEETRTATQIDRNMAEPPGRGLKSEEPRDPCQQDLVIGQPCLGHAYSSPDYDVMPTEQRRHPESDSHPSSPHVPLLLDYAVHLAPSLWALPSCTSSYPPGPRPHTLQLSGARTEATLRSSWRASLLFLQVSAEGAKQPVALARLITLCFGCAVRPLVCLSGNALCAMCR